MTYWYFVRRAGRKTLLTGSGIIANRWCIFVWKIEDCQTCRQFVYNGERIKLYARVLLRFIVDNLSTFVTYDGQLYRQQKQCWATFPLRKIRKLSVPQFFSEFFRRLISPPFTTGLLIGWLKYNTVEQATNLLPPFQGANCRGRWSLTPC